MGEGVQVVGRDMQGCDMSSNGFSRTATSLYGQDDLIGVNSRHTAWFVYRGTSVAPAMGLR